MRIPILFYITVTASSLFVVFLFWYSAFNLKSSNMHIRFKRNRYKELKDTFKEQFQNVETENIFKVSGFNISGLTYQVVRYFMLLIWIVYMLYLRFFTGVFTRNHAIIWAIVFIVTSPRTTFLGRKSPFSLIIEYFQRRFRIAKNREIFRAISQLKNLSLANADYSIGSDFILNELMKFSDVTKPIFINMLQLWHVGRKEEACKYFSDAIDTNEGRELSNIFLVLDELEPIELKEQLELYQSTAKDIRRTYKEKADESKGNIIFAIAMISALLVLINFIIITIVIDALEYYKNFHV